MKYIFSMLVLIGFATIFFSAGASDLDSITFKELVYRVLIGLGLFVIGVRGLGGVKRANRR